MPRVLTICLMIQFSAAAEAVAEQCIQDGENCGDGTSHLQLSTGALNSDGTSHLQTSTQKVVQTDDSSHHPLTQADKDLEMKDMKMKFNNKGDLRAFLSSLVAACMAFLMMCAFFCVAYRRYPLVFSNNVLNGTAPGPIPDTYLGWVGTAWNVTPEEIEKTSGLDAAMFMEFVRLSMRVCWTIGVPMVLILCPLHYFAGSETSAAALAGDRLSKLGMGNVVPGEGARWVYWVHAAFVWFVVYVTCAAVCEAQQKFLKKRYDWLLRMPAPRATTVLVEGIPDEYCTDEDLRACFARLFPEKAVDSAYIVRKTAQLECLVASYERAEQSLAEANFKWQALGGTEDTRPTRYSSIFGNTVDKIHYYEEQKMEAEAAVVAERTRLSDPATDKSEVYSNNGFVTFRTERDAKIALSMKVRADECEFEMSNPPDPSDVQYNDLYASPANIHASSFFGYACIVALFFGFTPIVLAISSIVNLAALRKLLPVVDRLVVAFPMTQHLLEGVLASAALTLFMSFLPTFLNLIFGYFFQLKAGRWAQHRLQIYYYWFLVIFVLLITAVGSSLLDTMEDLIKQPMMIFGLLADRLPAATHFYLNFMAMQYIVHGMGLTRYINLMKFKAFSAICDEQRARELAEPEDQDFYGMGARSARFTLNLVIALVYCSLCPLITVVTWINFLLARLVFSYLLVFAEDRKSDLGGVFWVTQLTQVLKGLFIYVMLMVGVLSQRSASVGPTLLAAPALLYMARQYSRFHSAYEWEAMPFEEFVEGQKRKAEWPKEYLRESTRSNYAQPELTEPALTAQKKM